MRLSAATFLALATAAPRLAYGGEDDFAHIRSLIAQLENETNTLAALYAAKEDEIADLVATCGTTSSDELSGSPSSTKTQAPITPATSGSPNKAGSVSTEYSTDGSGSNDSEEYSSSSNRGRRRKKPTEGNNSSGGTGEPTEGGSSSGTEEPIDKGSSSGTEEPVVGSSSGTNKDSGPVTGGRWTPKVGDSYAYNLKPPVDMDANFDVFFIYFSEYCKRATLSLIQTSPIFLGGHVLFVGNKRFRALCCGGCGISRHTFSFHNILLMIPNGFLIQLGGKECHRGAM